MRMVRQGVLLMIIVGGMVLAHLAWRQYGQRLDEQAVFLEQEAQSLQLQTKEADKLTRLRSELIRRLRIQQELQPPIMPSQLLALIGDALPQSANLLNLTLQDSTPVLKEKSASASGSGATPQTESGNGKSVPPAIIRITLMGLAPSDAEIADFFGGMVELPVFENAKLLYSRPTHIGPLLAREYRIELEAPLDRRIVPMAQAGQGVVNAD